MAGVLLRVLLLNAFRCVLTCVPPGEIKQYTYIPINIKNDDNNNFSSVNGETGESQPVNQPAPVDKPVATRSLPAECRTECKSWYTNMTIDPPCDLMDGTDAFSIMSNIATKQFQAASGQFQNILTGIKNGKGGAFDGYLAVMMYPKDMAGIDTGPIDIKENRVLEFDIWENTNQLNVQIVWVAHNSGSSQGAVGLDNIRWLKPSDSNPGDLALATPICTSFS